MDCIFFCQLVRVAKSRTLGLLSFEKLLHIRGVITTTDELYSNDHYYCSGLGIKDNMGVSNRDHVTVLQCPDLLLQSSLWKILVTFLEWSCQMGSHHICDCKHSFFSPKINKTPFDEKVLQNTLRANLSNDTRSLPVLMDEMQRDNQQ